MDMVERVHRGMASSTHRRRWNLRPRAIPIPILLAALLVGCEAAPAPTPATVLATPAPGTPDVADPEPTTTPDAPVPAAPTPTPAATEAPLPTAAPSPTAAQSDPVEDLRLVFEEVDVPAGLRLNSVTWTPAGFLVGGCRLTRDGSCGRAVILRSDDGFAWSRSTIEGASNGEVVDIGATPMGLVAAGREFRGIDSPDGPRQWRSDDGATWTPFETGLPTEVVFEQVESVRGATVLFGWHSPPDTFRWPVVARSRDGGRWSLDFAPMSAVVRALPGFVAIGHPCFDVCPDVIPLDLQISRNGTTWSEQSPGRSARALTASAAGAHRRLLVAAGRTGPTRTTPVTAWRLEDDGLVPSGRLPGSRGIIPAHVVSDGARVLVFGAEAGGDPTKAWTSDDLEAWSRLPVRGLSGFQLQIAIAEASVGPGPVVAVDGESLFAAVVPR